MKHHIQNIEVACMSCDVCMLELCADGVAARVGAVFLARVCVRGGGLLRDAVQLCW
jgi:hypothetical protein